MTDTNIFDEVLADVSPGKHEADTETQATEQAAQVAETNASDAKTVLTLPAGEAPEGAVQVAEFAKLVNEKLVGDRVQELLSEGKAPYEAAMEALNAQVSQASFYQAVKAQRNPLPHYEVRYEIPVVDENGAETGEVKVETKVFIPVEAGIEFWQTRPTRGGGGAARTEEDIEKRLFRAGKKAVNLRSAEARLEKLTENVKSMREQLEKYTEWLTADGKTLDDAIKVYEDAQEAEEAENAIGDNE